MFKILQLNVTLICRGLMEDSSKDLQSQRQPGTKKTNIHVATLDTYSIIRINFLLGIKYRSVITSASRKNIVRKNWKLSKNRLFHS